MPEDKPEFNQEEMFKNMFGGSSPQIDPSLFGAAGFEKAMEGMEKIVKVWGGKERMKDYAELANWAVRTRFETLSTVSALAATLLIVATFNGDVIHFDNTVRVVLTALLLMMPGSLWALYFETSRATEDSLNSMYGIAEESMGKEAANKIKAPRKSSFRGAIPLIVYGAFTVISFAIIWLIWR